jgi:putative solute:sodium symporter small subunit
MIDTGMDPASDQRPARHRAHWQASLRLTGVLLLLWFGATFGVAYFARALSFNFFGWPFSFWVAGQGAILLYVSIIAVYAHRMNRLDQDHGVAEEPGP